MINYASDIAQKVSEETERSLLNQLQYLIDTKMLVVYSDNPVLVQDKEGKISVQKYISLELRDQEYIKKLENENKELKEKFSLLQDIFERALKNENKEK